MTEGRGYNVLLIDCGGVAEQFSLVSQCLPRSGSTSGVRKTCVQVDDEQSVKFYSRSFSDSHIKESIPSDVDVFIIFYDTTKPETVTVYDNFIRVVALTEKKVVRVVGIQPLSHKRCLKRKSLRSKSIGYRWGDNHQIVSVSSSPEMVRRELYRSIGAELINGHAHTSFNDTNQVAECAIL